MALPSFSVTTGSTVKFSVPLKFTGVLICVVAICAGVSTQTRASPEPPAKVVIGLPVAASTKLKPSGKLVIRSVNVSELTDGFNGFVSPTVAAVIKLLRSITFGSPSAAALLLPPLCSSKSFSTHV